MAIENNNPTPKRLVLSLLSAPSLPQVSIAMLVRWGELFDIDSATMRVTVGRLTRQGLLSSPDRGVYTMGPEGKLMAETARDWANVESRLGTWSGEWIFVHTSHLGRVDRRALRARERAFRLGGFAEHVQGLWCRPANLAEDTAATRTRLLAWGLEPGAIVLRASDAPGVGDRELYRLWPRRQIEAAYRRHCRAMTASASRLEKLSLQAAARETLLTGEAVIRQINADPLLPDAMINARARREMIAAMVDYDALGRDVWRRYFSALA